MDSSFRLGRIAGIEVGIHYTWLLALAAAAWLAWLAIGGGYSPLAAVLRYLANVNLLLALFNLIPGFPLDGGRVLRSVLWTITGDPRRATWVATRIGQGIALLFIL